MNTDDSFNFPIHTSHEGNALSSIYPNSLSMSSIDIDIDSVDTLSGFELSGITGSSFDSPNGLSCMVAYPPDWQEKNKRFIILSNPYDSNDQNTISLFGQFKAIYFTEGRQIEGISYLNFNDGRFKSLASISSKSPPSGIPFSLFNLVPEQNHNKFSIVKHILNDKIPTQNLNNCTRLFFSIIAQNGERKLGKTNWIEITSHMNSPNILSSDSYLNLLNFSYMDSEPLNQPISSVDNGRSFISAPDIKNIKLEYLKPEQKNFLASNCNIFFKLIYPNDWPEDYQLINEEDNQKENTISLIGRFKATSYTERVQGECNLSSKLSDGKWESLADMTLDEHKSQFLSSDSQKIICFKIRPKIKCTKNFIVQKLLQEKIQEKISHNTVNRYSLFFYVAAFDGQRQIGQTNDIEIRVKKNQDNLKKKNIVDKHSKKRKRKRIESPSSSNAEPPLNSMLAQINEQNLSTQIPNFIRNEMEKQRKNTKDILQTIVENYWREIDLFFEEQKKALLD